MTDTTAPSVRLTKWIKASPARVFEAWTRADQIASWLSPDALIPLANVEADVRIGGRYRFAYVTPDTPYSNTVSGTYIEVEPPARLVFTWIWQSPHSEFDESFLGRESLVSVLLVPVDGGTQVTLTHTGLPEGFVTERHIWGWTGALDQLASYIDQ